MACWSHTSPVSMATATKMFVSVMLVYLDVFKVVAWLDAALVRLDVAAWLDAALVRLDVAAWLDAAPVRLDASPMCD